MTSNQQPETKDWKRMWFKTNKVWMAVDSTGAPLTRDGKVLIKYQLKQEYEYWVNKSNVAPLDAQPEKAPSQNKKEHRPKRGRPKIMPSVRVPTGTRQLTRIKFAYLPTGLLPVIRGLPASGFCCVTTSMKKKFLNLLEMPPTTSPSSKPSRPGFRL